MQIQNFYAALDQRLHTGKFPLEKPTIEIMEEVHTKFYGIPYVHNTVLRNLLNYYVIHFTAKNILSN